MNGRRARRIAAGLAWLALLAGGGVGIAGEPGWKLVRPSNTGIPGIQLHYARFAPDGTLWVAGRWPFWGEGGIGIYDIGQDLWTTISNVDTPLPSQWVNEVAFDAAGAAWIATDGGLARRQGDQWTIWSTANAPFLHDQIDDVAIAPNGHIWVNNSGVQTTDAAIFEFDGQNWRRYSVGVEIPFALPWKQLSEVLVTPDGHAWVCNDVLNGVAEFDGQTWTLRGAEVGRFGSGLVDLNGDLWFVAGIGGGNQFWRYQRAANTWTQFGPNNTPFVNTTITRLGMDEQGRVYCGNWFGQIIRFDGVGWEQVANVGDAVYGICPASNGDLWAATLGNGRTGELHHVDRFGAVLRRYNTWNTGMPDYFIDKFDLDPQGNLWFASGEAGLSRFDGLRWRNWGNHNSGSEPYPWAGNEPMGGFYLDSLGVGWMGGNGIGRWEPETGQFTGFWNWQNNPGMGVTLFTHFAEDVNGTLFAATDGGAIYRFDGNLWVSVPVLPGGYTSTYAGIHADSAGNVYGAGLWNINIWNGSSWSTIPLPNPNYFFDLGGIEAFAVGPDDTLWIGTDEGLVRYAGGQFTLFDTTNSPLPAMQVRGIDVRADGVVALSSHEFGPVTPFPSGVAVIRGDPSNPANWSTYGYGTHPIPHYQLGPVKFDANGDLWISAISEACAVLLIGEGQLPPGDINGDGLVNVDDVDPFVRVLIGMPLAPEHVARSDLNGDGTANGLDMEVFIALLVGR